MFVLSQDEKNSCKELVRLAKIAKRDDANEGDITVVDIEKLKYTDSEKRLYQFIYDQSYETLRKMTALMEYGRDNLDHTDSIETIYKGQGETPTFQTHKAISDYLASKSAGSLIAYFEAAERFFK